MSTTSPNYGYVIPVGSDAVNLLPQMAANFSDIDTDLKNVSDDAIGSATELLTGSVHSLTRSDTDRDVFTFVATSDFTAGETFEVDGVQVTAKTPDGQNLSTGAYVINSGVLCLLNGTLLTVIVNPSKALDADKLDGHDSSYFATAGDLSVLDNQVGAVSSKVGTGVLDVGNDCVDGINTLNTQLSSLENKPHYSDYVSAVTGNYEYTATKAGNYYVFIHGQRGSGTLPTSGSIKKNGNVVSVGYAAAGIDTHVSTEMIISLSVGDVVRFEWDGLMSSNNYSAYGLFMI